MRKRRGKLAFGADDLHAAAAAAGRRLEHDRKADLARQSLPPLRRSRCRRRSPGTVGMPSSTAARLAAILSPISRICSGPRTDEVHVVLGEDFREAGVLGEKAVARMHGVGAGDFAGGEQRRNIEIAVLGRRRADADALVGEPHMHGIRVRRRMHGDRRDAELLAGAQHAERDLSPIGDQNLIEHRDLGVNAT